MKKEERSVVNSAVTLPIGKKTIHNAFMSKSSSLPITENSTYTSKNRYIRNTTKWNLSFVFSKRNNWKSI